MKVIAEETARIWTDSGTCLICYRMLSAKAPDSSVRYGICIENVSTGEIAEVQDITSIRVRADVFFGSLVSGLVTPVHLQELAEDFVASFT